LSHNLVGDLSMKTLSLRSACDIYHGSDRCRKATDNYSGLIPYALFPEGSRRREYIRRFKLQRSMDTARISVVYVDMSWIALKSDYDASVEVIHRNGYRSYRVPVSEFITLCSELKDDLGSLI